MRRRCGRRGWGVALGVLGLGCATAGARVPIGTLELDAWRRSELPGLTIYSASDAPGAGVVVRNLEEFVRLVSELVLQSEFTPRRPARLFLFASDAQYQSFEGRSFVLGHAVPGDDGFTVGMSLESAGVSILQHEMVHLLLFNHAGASYPAWFHEGLAVFLSTAAIRSGIATIGPLPGGRRATLTMTGAFPLDRLLSSASSIQSTGRGTARFYANAWAFVHYGLMSHGMGGPQRSGEFMRYVRAVSRGEPWEEAFEHSFGAPLEEIEEEYRRHRKLLVEAAVHPQVHLDLGMPPGAPVEFEPVEAPKMARRLGDYALALGPGRLDLAARLFDVALAADSADAEALVGRMRVAVLREELDRADLLWGRLSAGDRESPAGWLAIAELAHARYAALEERARGEKGAALLARAREGYARVLEATPDHRGALLSLGRTYLLEPEPADLAPGIDALEQAVLAHPRDRHARLALARLYLQAEEHEPARPHLRFVLDAYPDTGEAREAKDLLARIPAPRSDDGRH